MKEIIKAIILSGGLGTRLSEETDVKPKPMVEIGPRPILWHILKIYAHYGFNEFYIALGYKGEIIKRYFLDYQAMAGDLSIQLANGQVERRNSHCENWHLHLVETGIETLTGGRILRLQPYLQDGTFMATYGDGVADINLQELLRFHHSHGRLATVTAVRPPARFGGLILEDGLAVGFSEKPQIGEGWINGGFFVFEPGIFDFFHKGDATVLETDVLPQLATDRQLAAYQHEGFWQCMDTLREKRLLETLWNEGGRPWKVWQD